MKSLLVTLVVVVVFAHHVSSASLTRGLTATIIITCTNFRNSFFDFLANEKKKMVCYYGSWAVYRPGNGKFDVEAIDPFLCTHIVYGFTGLGSDNTIQPIDPYNDLYENWGKGAFLRFTGLKKINPQLKTLLAIGGWNEGSEKYSVVCSKRSNCFLLKLVQNR